MPDLRRPCAPRLIEAASLSAATIKGGKPAPSASASCWSGENPVTQRSSKQGAAKLFDHLRGGGAFGAGREAQRHAMAQHGSRQRNDIVGRRRQPSVPQRARPGRKHERLAGGRGRSPGG